MRREQCIHEETGEILMTAYGLSGVCVMQCAGDCKTGDQVSIDFAHGLSMDGQQILRELRRRRKLGMTLDAILTGWFVPRLQTAILRASGVYRLKSEATDEALHMIAQAMTDFRIRILKVRGFEYARRGYPGMAMGDTGIQKNPGTVRGR